MKGNKRRKDSTLVSAGEVLNTNLSGTDKFGSLIKFLPKMQHAHRVNTRAKEVVSRQLCMTNSFYREDSLFLNVYINSVL